jgi:hypothetical protein
LKTEERLRRQEMADAIKEGGSGSARSSSSDESTRHLSETQQLIRAFNSDPKRVAERPSTSKDRTSSDLGEGTSKVRRPGTAPESSGDKPKEKDLKTKNKLKF